MSQETVQEALCAKQFDGKKNHPLDNEIEERLLQFFEKHAIDARLILRNFPLYVRRATLKRHLAHYELFRRVVNLPGDIVELGVYRGTSLMEWANFFECRNIGDRTRRVIGFDHFEGFSSLDPKDGPEDEASGKVSGGFSCKELEAQLEEIIEIFDADRFIPQKARIELVKGDIEETVPQFVEEQPGTRISLLHFDCDLYRPTLTGLKHLFPLVVKGGIVVFDEYGINPFAGESQAVDEYFDALGLSPKWEKFDWHATPSAFFVKN